MVRPAFPFTFLKSKFSRRIKIVKVIPEKKSKEAARFGVKIP